MSPARLSRLLLLVALCLSGQALAQPGAPFDGSTFQNLQPTHAKSLGGFLKWRWERKVSTDWQYRDLPPPDAPPAQVSGREAAVTFINHSTVLLQIGGVNILTDPIWSERASPVQWYGPARFHRPALNLDQLPHIDLVVISHNHYDHLDLATLQELEQRFQPQFVVGLRGGQLLRDAGLSRVQELDWWQTLPVNAGLSVHGVPAQHWSSRILLDRNQSLWLGYVFQTPAGYVYFAGDSGQGPHYRMIHDRFGAPALALLPIGAYLPRWFMRDNHMSPADAVLAHAQLESRASMGVHYGTFALADEGAHQAQADLAVARQQQGIAAERFWAAEPGRLRKITLLDGALNLAATRE